MLVPSGSGGPVHGLSGYQQPRCTISTKSDHRSSPAGFQHRGQPRCTVDLDECRLASWARSWPVVEVKEVSWPHLRPMLELRDIDARLTVDLGNVGCPLHLIMLLNFYVVMLQACAPAELLVFFVFVLFLRISCFPAFPPDHAPLPFPLLQLATGIHVAVAVSKSRCPSSEGLPASGAALDLRLFGRTGLRLCCGSFSCSSLGAASSGLSSVLLASVGGSEVSLSTNEEMFVLFLLLSPKHCQM